MKLLIAPDSFKGSLSARAAAEAVRAGVLSVLPDAETVLLPVADGGEGTLDALCPAGQCERIVTGPAGDRVRARFGLTDAGGAVIEMAQAAGLGLLPPDADPLSATTLGVGELIAAALDAGARSLTLTVGGSGTTDCGIGLAHALGVRFLGADGRVLPPVARSLSEVVRVDAAGLDPRLAALPVALACDVDNPLCGERGATRVYGPQKGVTEELAPALDAAMLRTARALAAAGGRTAEQVFERPGSGAGGGVTVPLLALTGARMLSGIEAVLAAIGFDACLPGADLVITGEGRFDLQSLSGKAVSGVAAHAAAAGVPLAVLCGDSSLSPAAARAAGAEQLLTLTGPGISAADAIARAPELLAARAAELAARL